MTKNVEASTADDLIDQLKSKEHSLATLIVDARVEFFGHIDDDVDDDDLRDSVKQTGNRREIAPSAHWLDLWPVNLQWAIQVMTPLVCSGR